MKNRILIIDDDAVMAQELQILLIGSEKFECDLCNHFSQTAELITDHYYDACITKMDCLKIDDFNALDGQTTLPPTIILAEAEQTLHIPASYFTSTYLLEKPFRLKDLLDCLERMIVPMNWQVGPWQFQTDKNYLTAPNDKTNLTEKEKAILNYLCRANGKTVRRDKLLQDVWGYRDGVDTHTLETHIYRLRKKIEATIDKPQILLSNNNGYKLHALYGNGHGNNHAQAQKKLSPLSQ